jgi:hypothetical protein
VDLRVNLEEDAGKNEVASLCSQSLDRLKERNEQPESSRTQIHDGVTEDDSGVDEEELRKKEDSSDAPGPAVSLSYLKN